MAEVLLAAEVLPIGVLNPHRHHFFVGQVAGVLQKLQAHHQTQGVAGTTNAAGVQPAEAGLTGLPVDVLRKLHQRVTQADEIDQLLAEQVCFG